MEIVTEATIPKTPIQSESTNSDQKPEFCGSPDGEKKNRGQKQSKSECKTPSPDEKTEEKQRILVPKSPNVAGKVKQRVKFGGIEFPKNGTPHRLKVPNAFKFPERYTSPTDLMMSPISKGLLARTRKGAVPSKMHELSLQS